MGSEATKKRHMPLRARSIKSNNIMKTKTFIPSHYRKLAPGEVYRAGDLIKGLNLILVSQSGGVVHGKSKQVSYYRRRHVRVKPSPVPAKNPLVSFYYPMSDQPWNSRQRHVRVIGTNNKYLIGLEIGLDNTFKFKKFLKPKITRMELLEFSPESVK
jgi:hypothetical protein